MTKPPRGKQLRPVGDLVGALLDPILARKAGMTMGLIGAWPEIAGSGLEAVSRPEKLLWRNRQGPDEPFRPATLVVACEGASVLRLQHQSSELIGRVNTFFGYHAVDRIKIVQRPVAAEPASRKPRLGPLGRDEARRIEEMTSRIEDPRLRAALMAFSESVYRRRGVT